jgi:DNA-binding response OmpR family regulator
MLQTAPAESRKQTRILLIEYDPESRGRHAEVLENAGYHVVAASVPPSVTDTSRMDIIVADVHRFPLVRAQHPRVAVLVVADDVHEGVSACLRGAEDWVPRGSTPEYLLTAVSCASGARRR